MCRWLAPLAAGIIPGLALCPAVAGCALLSPLPDLRTAADHARELEPRCGEAREEDMEPLLARASVDAVRPAYVTVPSGPAEREARLRGARIQIRPRPGMSVETLTRAIECHQVRSTLGEVQAIEGDPYVLPGRWLEVDVSSGRDGFVVVLHADGIEDARLVLERARRFAWQVPGP